MAERAHEVSLQNLETFCMLSASTTGSVWGSSSLDLIVEFMVHDTYLEDIFQAKPCQLSEAGCAVSLVLFSELCKWQWNHFRKGEIKAKS